MKNGLAPPIIGSMLNKRFNTYDLRNFQEFATERKTTVWYGLEIFSYRYPQLWSLLPESLKEMNSLSQFKRNIKHWICRDCPCRLWKVYIQNLGFFIVQSYLFVKLANLATLSKKKIFFFIQIDMRVYIYLHNKCIINVAISINLTSHLA